MFHVDDDAPEGGDGSAESPFRDVASAIDATRADGTTKAIGIWPGRYAGSIALDADLDGDADLSIRGCGPAEVTLTPTDSLAPGVKITGATGITLGGFALEGANRGLWGWGGADLTAFDLWITGASRSGVVIDGSDSVASLDRVAVSGSAPDAKGRGAYGFTFQRSTVTLTGSTVQGARGAGVLVDGSEAVVVLEDIEVTDTAALDGAYGRGVQIQGQPHVTIQGARLSGNRDAGIFALQPGGLVLEDVEVVDTVAASVTDSDQTSGDGVVVVDGALDADWASPYFAAELRRVAISGGARAGVLLSGNGVSAALEAVTIDPSGVDPGGGLPLAQGGPTVTGSVYDLDAAGVVLEYTAAPVVPDALDP
jgi:hypothetical protein